MNVELLLRVKDHILANPKQLDMGSFNGYDNNSCGTVMCIAGWLVRLSDEDEDDLVTEHAATKLLGVDNAAYLFYTALWPVDLRNEILKFPRPGKLEAAKLTAEAIDRFIQANK